MPKLTKHDTEYKVQAVKLAREIGQNKAARELGIIVLVIDAMIMPAVKACGQG